MTKPRRSLIWVLVAIVVLLAIAVTVVFTSLDLLVKRALESTGGAATGAPVSVDRVEISVGEGTGAVSGFRIGNPPGFDTDYAVQVDSIDLVLDAQSLTTDTIVIRRLTIDSARLIADYRAVGNGGPAKSNLGVISDNLDAYTGPDDAPDDPGIQLVIETFRLSNAEMRVVHDQLGVDRRISVPEFTLTDIGRQGAGATIDEAVRRMLQPIIRRALEAARKQALQRGRDRLEEEIKEGVGELLGGNGEEADGN